MAGFPALGLKLVGFEATCWVEKETVVCIIFNYINNNKHIQQYIPIKILQLNINPIVGGREVSWEPQLGGAMLNPELITREDLYEAIWSEPVQKVAQALGISDVGLAKICKRLKVPRPGRGYWMKPRGVRKVLKEALPPLPPEDVETYKLTWMAGPSGYGWSKEVLRRLAEDGVRIPVAPDAVQSDALHPLITQYRPILEREENIERLKGIRGCLDLNVSKGMLDRGLAYFSALFRAFEEKGYPVEVRQPHPERRVDSYYFRAEPSRTGVVIKGVMISFAIWEGYYDYKVPADTPGERPGGNSYARGNESERCGRLTLEILEPTRSGMRRRWTERVAGTLEMSFNGFFRNVMALAEAEHAVQTERERQRREEEDRKRRAIEEEVQRAEKAARAFDLNDRLMDLHQAQATREFTDLVRRDAAQRGIDAKEDSELGGWLKWADALAEQLEQEAIQSVLQRREAPSKAGGQGGGSLHHLESGYRQELDLWQRRFVFGRR